MKSAKRSQLPRGFSYHPDENHWSNEEETIKFAKHIISPRAIAARKELKLPEDQKALLIWDVLKGQCTGKVIFFGKS